MRKTVSMQWKNLLLSISLIISLLLPYNVYAQIVKEEIQYSIIGDNTVEVFGIVDKYYNANVIIPSKIMINGKNYIVEAIGKEAFKHCRITGIELPNTIKIIRKSAFSGSDLEKIILPMGLERIEDYGFEGCKKLKYVSFPPSLIYLGQSCFGSCYNLVKQTGFHGNIERGGSYPNILFFETPIEKEVESSVYCESFSYKYIHKIYKAMTEWQKKKPFETFDDWRIRVTPQTRTRKMAQYVEQFKEEYAQTEGAKATLDFKVSLYDDEYNMYVLESERFGVCYVSVPTTDKELFKNRFTNSAISPVWCVKDNQLGVESMSVKIGVKTYSSPPMIIEETEKDINLAMDLPVLDIELENNVNKKQIKHTISYDKTLDINIPMTENQANNTFVIAIGNEKYQLVPQVLFAENDVDIFSLYCQKTIGVPIPNIRKYKNATYGVILSALSDIKDIAEAYNGNINLIFYYAGHGIPNEQNNTAYLLPVDADGKQTEACFSLSRLYSELQSLNARSVVVFMDACFSGAQRGEGMLASARGVAIKAKSATPQGNMVVFSAASGDETAYPYKEKGHGMFTYFLLKKLNETKGNVTLGELGDYITTQVKQQSVVVNRKSQTPTVVPSSAMSGEWRGWKLK